MKQPTKRVDVTNNPVGLGRVALIPAFNESRFIGSVVLAARLHVDKVIVVDDGSADSTALIAQYAGAEVIQMPQNGGKVAAVQAGLAYAAQLKPQVLVMLDGDGQHDASEIERMIAPIEDGSADLVIGSRFGTVVNDIPKWRQVGQHTLTWVTNRTSGVALTDSQSGFRAFSKDVLPLLDFQTDGFSIESEMQFIIKEHDLRVGEVPISVSYEEGPKRNPVTHGLQVLNGILRLVGTHRPLLYFSVPGFILFALAGLLGLWIIQIYQQTTTLAVGYGLVCVLLASVGTTCISTGLILHSIRAWLVGWKPSA